MFHHLAQDLPRSTSSSHLTSLFSGRLLIHSRCIPQSNLANPLDCFRLRMETDLESMLIILFLSHSCLPSPHLGNQKKDTLTIGRRLDPRPDAMAQNYRRKAVSGRELILVRDNYVESSLNSS